MKFDFCIGNPPYQENIENRGEQPPLYHFFYDAARTVANCSILITPARFLFGVGKTPRQWDQKMLNDEHFKVLNYWPASKSVFNGVDIKGGVAVGCINESKNYGAIEVFIQDETLRNLATKVLNTKIISLNTIMYSNTSYKYSSKFFIENPGFEERVSGGSARYLSSSVFDKFPEVFIDKPANNKDYIQIIGRQNNTRVKKYLKRDYINPPENFDYYKVFLPSSNGSGALGEVLSTPLVGEPLVGEPLVGSTETFISFGKYDTKEEANNLMKYIKTKFARTMLGTKKVTQGNKTPNVWSNVPFQDFTKKSDIDWSKSIHEIDVQLYKKYNLSEEEIQFIETHVKEMA